jgi:hypothetical protein
MFVDVWASAAANVAMNSGSLAALSHRKNACFRVFIAALCLPKSSSEIQAAE